MTATLLQNPPLNPMPVQMKESIWTRFSTSALTTARLRNAATTWKMPTA